MMMWLKVLMSLVFLSGISFARDLTVTTDATGSDVVGAVVDLIRQPCIFDDDKLLLRRIAVAETNDGTTGSIVNGGIWQINQNDFTATKTTTSSETIARIRDVFGIDWISTAYSELRKPLFSGLAARLKIDYYYNTTGTQIPQKVDSQALYWAQNYTTNNWGDLSSAVEFFTNVSTLLSEACASPTADIVFLLDGSGSIGSSNFNLIRQFVIAVVHSFDISQQKVRIGLIEFSSSAVPQFNLSAYNTKADVQNAVLNIPYYSGDTNTAAGLLATINMIKNDGRQSEGVAVMSIVLTDGQSNNQRETNRTAERFHQELPEVTVFSVGVGSGAVVSELSAIASSPSCLNVFQLSGFTDITSFTDQIMEQACKAPAVISSNDLISGSVGYNQHYYFKATVTLRGNKIVIRVKASVGGIKVFFSWKIRNPNAALYDYIAEVDDSIANGKEVTIAWDSTVTRLNQNIGEVNEQNTDETQETLYGAVVGAQQRNNEFDMSFHNGSPAGLTATGSMMTILLVLVNLYAYCGN